MQEKNEIKGMEIKEKIDFNNKLMKDNMSLSTFLLNNVIRDLIIENAELQKSCPHQYSEGYCIYCYKMEEE